MSRILIFAGTTEGRLLAEFLNRQKVQAYVCVATEYGGQLLEENKYLEVSHTRLNQEEMQHLIAEKKIQMTVDATHPYAAEVSANIKGACEETGCEYIRLLRSQTHISEKSMVCVESVDEAVEFLKQTKGNILATTGSKELHKYTAIPEFADRVFARVLSTPEVAEHCAALGFTGKHLICMQGPFSEELNTALLKQFDARWLVTKEAGKNGGYEEKIRAARKAGARVVLVGRPVQESGLSLEEVERYLVEKAGISVRREISVIGIGMGSRENMTYEALKACQYADLLVGAGRMLEQVQELKKPVFVSYKPDEIYDYVMSHPEYEKVALLQSGDLGFYSGAKKLMEKFAGEEILVYPGISSVVYLCDRLHTAWEDVVLTSQHGRYVNLISKIRKNQKVFALMGKGSAVNELCRKMREYHMDQVILHVGQDLSYPAEKIQSGTAAELENENFADLCVILAKNPQPDQVITHGLEDEVFLRAKVPMTKSEVRSISLSKLHLTKDSIVYDVGAGTGSISIEAALQAEDGYVYAIEKKEEAVELMRENKKKFAADNLEIVEGLAPEALEELPSPTHVFVGGSSGNLKTILELVLKKNPQVRIVINCIALETVAEALDCVKTLPVTDVDIAAVSVGKSKEIGRYHMMMGQNPVYVISCTGGKAE